MGKAKEEAMELILSMNPQQVKDALVILRKAKDRYDKENANHLQAISDKTSE